MLEYGRIDISKGIDVNQISASKNVAFVIIGILKILGLSMNHIFAMVVMQKYKKLWLLMMLPLFMLKEVLTEFTFFYMSKDDAITIINDSNLIDKKGVL